MAIRKLYAGVILRDMRGRLGLTQKAFATRLGVSLPYLNQMENNHRPVSASVVLALAHEFGFDVTELGSSDAERMVLDMREALADPVFAETPPLADLRLAASNAPALSRAFLNLHRAYRQSHERLASLDAALDRDTSLRPSAWEEVRDFFHYCDNYLDAIDRAAEHYAAPKGDPAEIERICHDTLATLRIDLHISNIGPLRHYDSANRRLHLSRAEGTATLNFQLLHQIALLTRADLLDATLDLARFQTDEARGIARIGLANYFAGAALLPYTAFLDAARDTRHDLERLAARFDASVEQVAHRLSTLQRPGARGVPFFFVRVDQAGTITKRHSATRFQFARYGGACPLWNVHQAFETPGRFLRQLAETPDGVRYICLARDVSKPGGAYGAPTRRYAIGLGCEIEHASTLVYADGLDLKGRFAPIGVSCRICARPDCHQRSVPPLEHALRLDPDRRGVLPYAIASATPD